MKLPELKIGALIAKIPIIQGGMSIRVSTSALAIPVAECGGIGTIGGSGTIANEDVALGASCFAEKRTVETLRDGKPSTPFMKFGDVVRIEMKNRDGHCIFGVIEQRIEPQPLP